MGPTHKARDLKFRLNCQRTLLFLVFFSQLSLAASHHPQAFLDKIQGSQKAGKEIYQHFCSACHALKPSIPLGAPRIKVGSDWQDRIKQGGFLLFKHADEGLNGMPPRGGCFECTDAQLLEAILELVPKKNRKMILDELRDHKKISK